jgi:hypothetical protein
MEDSVAIVAATNQSKERFGGCKMNFKFAAFARNNSHQLSRF